MMLVIVWMILVMVMMLMMVMMVIMVTMMLVKVRMKVMMVMIVAVIDGAGILVSSKEEDLVRLHHDSVQSWAGLFEIHILLLSLSSCFP